MFWLFLLATSLSAMLVELGAVSTKAGILVLGLQASVIIITILAILLLWKSFPRKSGRSAA